MWWDLTANSEEEEKRNGKESSDVELIIQWSVDGSKGESPCVFIYLL